jgi:predicted short-subunit dehydrogenase-like oxidoreductase (DUF2520 family)
LKTLNIIGAGRLGRTLALLWQGAAAFDIGSILNRSAESARAAATFIGSGQPVRALDAMRPAGVWMLATPDREIAACCAELARSGLLRARDIVFHCSGALGSSELQAASAAGAHVASVHPLKSFAEPGAAARTFAGTCCVAEGDRPALDVLIPAFETLGARVSEIDPQRKVLYHAASVIVCNYLTALIEAGLRCYGEAGISRERALTMAEPLVRETVDNVFRLGTVRALTGPLARGDEDIVARHLDALAATDPRLRELYRQLGAVALDIARAQGNAGAESLDRLERLLRSVDDQGLPGIVTNGGLGSRSGGR